MRSIDQSWRLESLCAGVVIVRFSDLKSSASEVERGSILMQVELKNAMREGGSVCVCVIVGVLAS